MGIPWSSRATKPRWSGGEADDRVLTVEEVLPAILSLSPTSDQKNRDLYGSTLHSDISLAHVYILTLDPFIEKKNCIPSVIPQQHKVPSP